MSSLAHDGDDALLGEAPICVLGMSRSGTSLTARLLNLCGVYLGSEEEFLRPLPPNPEGNWEHLDIVSLNEEILESLGGDWKEPPSMPPGWEASQALVSTRASAARLLDGAFADHDLWGWKDPRNCLTLPFWQQILPAVRYVICLRNPVDVVASLQRRDDLLAERRGRSDDIDAERGFRLWLRYVAAAIAHTAGRPRVFVSYEEYFDDWRAPVERLARFVDFDLAGLDADSERVIEGTIDHHHRHHRTALENALADARVPSEVAALYLIAEEFRTLAVPGVVSGGRLIAVEQAVDAYARRLLANGSGL